MSIDNLNNVIAATKVVATLVDLIGAAVAGGSDISDEEFKAALKEYGEAKVILKELDNILLKDNKDEGGE